MNRETRRSRLSPGAGDALVVVDVQRDFLPGGSLAVPHGDEVVGPLNVYLRLFAEKGLPIFATRDWHPADHCSFRARGGPWPVHCVAGSPGAEFAEGLALPGGVRIVSKDVLRDQDTYSGFQRTDLARQLRDLGVKRLYIGGIATDYCVLHTVLDALSAGFSVCLLEDAIRPVEVRPGDGEAAVRAMREKGALAVSLDRVGPGESVAAH